VYLFAGMKMTLHQRVRQRLSYDPLTGNFIWLNPPKQSRAKPGDFAGTLQTAGRKRQPGWRITFEGRRYARSRFAWFYMTGEWPKHQIDHKDRDTTNDAWENLREATCLQNQINRGANKNSTTGFRGVFRRERINELNKVIFYEAKIMRNYRMYFLGCFPTAESAHAAVVAKAQEMDGEFFTPA
jgi:hypothetical protein